MVIAKLYGGLGNQMYQYSAGLALAKRLKTEHYLDLSWFDEVKSDPELTLRWYELDGFGIDPKEVGLIQKLYLKVRPARVFTEKGFEFQEEFNTLSGNTILDGYWQSYKYFNEYSDDIRQAFKFPAIVKPRNQKLIREMVSSNSVLLHFRRGDYNTKRGKQFHGLIPINYYQKAVDDLQRRVNSPLKLFIFSDEIDWCKKNLKFNEPMVFVDSNSSNIGPEDMQLMASCKHMIIANSSFSWWAAWLNLNPDKIVYAPLAWFKGAKHDIDDRIPADWIKL